MLDCDVPHLDLSITKEQKEQIKQGSLIIEALIPLIDGNKHVKSISNEAKIDISICKMAIQHLVYFGIVKLFDVFQSTNKYIATQKLLSQPDC